jgi:hypothetical protein
MKLAIVAINSAKTVKGNQLREIDSGGGHCIFIESRSSQIISVHLRSSQMTSLRHRQAMKFATELYN